MKQEKKENVENEMGRLNMNVLGLSEVRWPGVGCVETQTGGSFIYSGGQTAERGVGVILDKMIKKCLIGYWAVSDSYCGALKRCPFQHLHSTSICTHI